MRVQKVRQAASVRRAAAVVVAGLIVGTQAVPAVAAPGRLTWSFGYGWSNDARKDAAGYSITQVLNRFNAYGDFSTYGAYNVVVNYNGGVPTAQAGFISSIDFGGTYPNERVTQHEFNHWTGTGTTSQFDNLFDGGGVWTGAKARQIIQQFDGDGALLRKSGVHFYGYGLNYDNEGGELNMSRNVALVYAMRQDMGLGNTNDPWSATNITLRRSDAGGTSSFNWTGGWNDGYFAHRNAAYSTGAFAIRTPNGTQGWTFAGDSLTVNSGGALLYNGYLDTGVVTIRDLILDGGTVKHDQLAADLFQLAGHVQLKSNSTFDAANGDILVRGVIDGPGTLTKIGNNRLTLSAANGYSGVTKINQGTLAITGQYSLGGSLYGGLNFDGGTLQYAANLTGNNGSADISRNSVGVAKTVTLTGNGTIDTNGNNVTYANAIGNNGAGWLVKTGAGNLTLNGANKYTGGTVVRGGTLEFTNAGSVTGSDTRNGINVEIALAAADVATLKLTAGTVSADRVIIGGNVFNNDGGNGTLMQASGTINSREWFSVGSFGNGTFNMSGGTVNQNAAGGTQFEVAVFGKGNSTVNLSGNAKINLLNNANLGVGVVNNTGTGTVNQNGGTVTFFSDANGSVGGTGNVILGQFNPTGTYTYNLNGGTLATGGVIRNATSATGVFNLNGGTLRATRNNAAYISSLSAANIKTGGAKIDTNGFNIGIAQPLLGTAGDGGLTKSGAGTLTLGGANTYAGTTTVAQGTLALTSAGTISKNLVLGSSGGATNAIVDVTDKPSFAVANVSGNGTINLGVAKTFTATGTVSPGFSAGRLDVIGNLVLGSTTKLELAGRGGVAGSDFDSVTALGALTYHGSLLITGINGFDLTQGGVFNLFDSATVSGDFSSVLVGNTALTPTAGLWTGTRGDTSYQFATGTGVLTIAAVPEPSTLGLLGLTAVGLLARRRRGASVA